MKAIMISDHAKWCALMMNGIKTIEIRMNKALVKAIQKLIDKNGYADIYVYCTKDNYSQLCYFDGFGYKNTMVNHIHNLLPLNGKVLFKFRCYKVEEIDVRLGHPEIYVGACIDDLWCLDNGYHDKNYLVNAIHISDLQIFDKPREVSEFKTLKRAKATDCFGCDVYQLTEMCIGNRCLLPKPLTKAPQNYCYIETEN